MVARALHHKTVNQACAVPESAVEQRERVLAVPHAILVRLSSPAVPLKFSDATGSASTSNLGAMQHVHTSYAHT